VLQYVKHAETRGVWGHAPSGKFLKIDAKILRLFHIYTMLLFCLQILRYAGTACVNG